MNGQGINSMSNKPQMRNQEMYIKQHNGSSRGFRYPNFFRHNTALNTSIATCFFSFWQTNFLRAYFDAKIIHNLNLAILILSFSICISKVWWQRILKFYTVQKCEYHLYFSKYSWIYGCLHNPNNVCTGHNCLGSQMISWTIWAETINRQKNVCSLAKQIAEQSITRKWKKKHKLSVEKK